MIRITGIGDRDRPEWMIRITGIRSHPSHAYHTYMLASLRPVLRVDVLPGDE